MIYAIVIIGILIPILIRNRLVGLTNRLARADSGIDVALKQRFDTLPNVVAAVKGYVAHEKQLLTEITALRTAAQGKELAGAERAESDQKMTHLLGRLMVAVENYPELKASENFQHLQRTINEIEERLSAARRNFNAAVMAYNNGIQLFPCNVVALILGYTKTDSFVIDLKEAKNPVVAELL